MSSILMLNKFTLSVFTSCPLRKSFFILRRNALQGFSIAVMATASPLRKLEDKVMCSICLDYLKDPVTIDCSHIFCYHCIIKVCESAQQPLYCSLCKTAFKKENIRHVWQMASIVKNIWRMKVDEERQPREDRPLAQRAEQLCGQHLEKLHYYCKDDQQILCVVCQESREHRHHAAVLLEKAAQPYQVRSLLDPSSVLGARKVLLYLQDKVQNFFNKHFIEV